MSNQKLTTRLLLVILGSGFLAVLLFLFLFQARMLIGHCFLDKGLLGFDKDAVVERLQASTKDMKLHFETEEEKKELTDLLKDRDKYTGFAFYDIETGSYQVSAIPKIINGFLVGELWGNDFIYTGDTYSETLEFADGTGELIIYSQHLWKFLMPYLWGSIVLCIFVFLLPVLLFVKRRMAYLGGLKDEILNMADGDLSRPVTVKGKDEIGILAAQLDLLRISLDENIQQEMESRKANHDLISAVSHDLRTPLTSLYGYLEIVKQKKCPPQKEAEYMDRCIRKIEEIRDLTDKMFEYSLVFDRTEPPELSEIPLAKIADRLGEHMEFLKLEGFSVQEKGLLQDENASGEREKITIWGNEPMLERIYNNLFSNILKYAEKKWEIQVKASVKRGRLKLTFYNHIRDVREGVESSHIGLKSVERMVKLQEGEFVVLEKPEVFGVSVSFPVHTRKAAGRYPEKNIDIGTLT